MGVAGNLLNASIFRKHRTPIVRQTEAAECGLACLAMIVGHHGHRIDLSALRRYCNISLKGMTLHDVVRVASQLQLSTRALRVEMSHLKQLRLPCILHWDHSHFVGTDAGRRARGDHSRSRSRVAEDRARGGVAQLHRDRFGGVGDGRL